MKGYRPKRQQQREFEIERTASIVDDIIGEQEAVRALDLTGYKNHVFRMVNFCFAFDELSTEEEEKIILAGCFHDIGIWTAETFDYIPPSIDAALEQLKRVNRTDWSEQIAQMIGEHHKIRRIKTDKLTEIFRKGDLVDFSLGTMKCGLDPSFVKDVKARFPNCGFHAGLLRTAAKWIVRHPLNPVPVIKW